MIRQKAQERLNDYLAVREITKGINSFIVPPGLGNQAGVLGAIALAEDALKNT
jgi:fructokinase